MRLCESNHHSRQDCVREFLEKMPPIMHSGWVASALPTTYLVWVWEPEEAHHAWFGGEDEDILSGSRGVISGGRRRDTSPSHVGGVRAS